MKWLKCGNLALVLTMLTGVAFMGHRPAEAATLYVGSFNNNSILRFDGETGEFVDTFVTASEGGLAGPVSLAFGPPNDALYVISILNASVLRYDGETGAFIDAFVPPGSGLVFPQDLTFDQGKTLYVADAGFDTIERYNSQTGQSLGPLFTADEAFCNAPFGVRFGPDSNLYFSCAFSNIVQRYNLETESFDNLGEVSSDLASPGGLTFDSEGNLYVANFRANTIDRYNAATSQFEIFISDVESPVQPIFGPDGNLYVSSNSSQKLGELVPGKVLRFDGRTGDLIDEFIPAKTGGLDGAGWLIFADQPPVQSAPEPSLLLGVAIVLGLSTISRRSG